MNLLKMVEELERDEGLRLKPYRDSRGFLTIGIGRNLDAKGIHRDEAYHLLHGDIEEAQALLNTFLPWWEHLDEVRQRVLLNMVFNMGLNPHAEPGKRGLWEFQRTLAMTKRGDYDGAATEMLVSEWAKQVGVRATRLSDMMRRGVV